MSEAFRETLKRMVLSFITNEPDPAERKARILIARQHGHLTDREAEDWIAILDLKAA